ncbi:MAG: GIY-YIG nuclease family protein [Saccharofermentanales bacterium]
MKPKNYWTFEKCREEALKYKYKIDFIKNSNGAYSSALKHKWLDDICSHMEILGNLKFRLVYSYEFDDNHVYVGLTCNEKRRNNQHFKTGPVYEHFTRTKSKPIRKILTDGYIEVKESQRMEKYWLDDYLSKGWIILNRSKTGAIGTDKLIWTKDKCQIESLKYNNKMDFYKKSNGAYDSAYRNDWLNDICNHMLELKKEKNHWILDNCKKEALKYSNKNDFRKLSNGAYESARKNNWLNDICKHMEVLRKPNGYWTFEKCREESLKYKGVREFSDNSKSAFNVSYKNKWLKIFYP